MGTAVPQQHTLALPSEPVVNVSKSVWPLSYDNMRPCLSGLNTYDSCMVMIAHESNLRLYVNSDEHGITVEKLRSPGTPWLKSAHFETTWDAPYLQPSIEVTKLHDFKLGFTQTDYYFSLAYMEDQFGFRTTFHYAMDDSTNRLGLVGTFTQEMFPQLSVEHDGRDSNVQRVGLTQDDQPRQVISSHDALFKLAVDRNELNLYRVASQQDDSDDLHILVGLGEVAVDNGVSITPMDLVDRNDSCSIDTTHGINWFLRSEDFTLPAGSSVQFAAWIATSDDSGYFARHHASVKYYCDLVDTSGSRVHLDSLIMDDSTRPVSPRLLQPTVTFDHNLRGCLEIAPVSGNVNDSGAKLQNIIAVRKLSDAFKRSSHARERSSEVAVTVDPNPFRDRVSIGFSVPNEGIVNLRVFDPVGNLVDQLANKPYRAGVHAVTWKPYELPSGIYTILLRFGNSVATARAVYVR